LAQEVAQAKNLRQLIDLQTRYVQSQLKWYADQTQEFGRLMARALSDEKDAKPVNDGTLICRHVQPDRGIGAVKSLEMAAV
jgi:hypothetical protein